MPQYSLAAGSQTVISTGGSPFAGLQSKQSLPVELGLEASYDAGSTWSFLTTLHLPGYGVLPVHLNGADSIRLTPGVALVVEVDPYSDAPSVAATTADGANVAQGTTTDAPVTAVEDATARTGISVWKGIKNFLRTISLLFGQGAPTQTCPSIATATAVIVCAANAARKYLYLENNSTVNIGISLKGVDPTGIAPTVMNEIIVLQPGQWWESQSNFVPTSAIKAYQTSGVTINTLSVVEG